MEEYVELCEPVKAGRAVEDWLSTVDIYCQFSRREGISRALIEAMNLGLPVVASNAGGTYELVDTRLLFRIGDVESATQIENLINDNDFTLRCVVILTIELFEFEKGSLMGQRREFWADFGVMRNRNSI